MIGGVKLLVHRYVIHVLDKNTDIILNDFEGKCNLSIDKFIQKQVKRIMKNELLRKAKFCGYEDNLVRVCCDNIIHDKKMFLENTKEIASYLYDTLKDSNDMQSCDLLISLVSIKDQDYVAILKLDYKTLHNHMIEFKDEKFNIQMIENEMAIQSNSAVKQAAIVSLNTLNTEYDLYVLDKEAEKIGDSSSFIKKFLDCEKVNDDTQKTKDFIDYSKCWINNCISDMEAAESVRSIRNHMLRSHDVMDIEKFCDVAIDSELQDTFKKFCEKNELNSFNIDKNVVDKKLNKIKLKTYTGFEIVARLEDFEDSIKFKLQKNIQGSYDLVIKNVEYFSEK